MEKEGKLRVVEGFVAKKDFTLPKDGVFTIGRSRRSSLPIMSRKAAREHAKITYRNGVFGITDLDSKTGTSVNGKPVKNTALRHNDLIHIASVKMRFLLEEPHADDAGAEKTPRGAKAEFLAPRRPFSPLITPVKPARKTSGPRREPESDITEIEVPAFSEEELQFVGTTMGGVKLIAPLAKGRRTLIYKGTHAGRNRVVAFKILKLELAHDRGVTNWFVYGAQQAIRLRHEDTVVSLGGGRAGDLVYSYAPFMERASAREQFANVLDKGLPAIKRVLESMVHVARALEFAKSKGVLHLGLRPTKILYNANHRAKLAGLGYDNGPFAPGLAPVPSAAAYLAPEQLTRSSEVTSASDMFSLGATCYYMLTGCRPKRDVRQRIRSPKDKNDAVPASICRIIEKMLNHIPSRRYSTYGQLIHDVRWALRGEAWPRAQSKYK